MPLVTAEQMRELEAAAVAAGTSEEELMANAGLAAAQVWNHAAAHTRTECGRAGAASIRDGIWHPF